MTNNNELRSLRIAKMTGTRQPLSETQSGNTALLKKLGNVYASNFDVNAMSEVLQDSTFINTVDKSLATNDNYKKIKSVVDVMIGQDQSADAEDNNTAVQQPEQNAATGNGDAPANAQKSEEIAKKADEIPPKAGEQVNNEYWHKVWASLSNKAGSLNGQEELQKVVNNFVTELGRIVNK